VRLAPAVLLLAGACTIQSLGWTKPDDTDVAEADSDLPAGDDDEKPPTGDDDAPPEDSGTPPGDTDSPPPVDTDVADTDVPPPADTGTPADRDGDTIPDTIDNCIDLANRQQRDLDADGDGDVCDDDRDGDGFTNDDDPWPDEGPWPGRATNEDIYVNTSGELWRFNVASQRLLKVGDFTFDQNGTSITDLAIDSLGILYAISFTDLFACRPDTARCRWLGSLPSSSNGLTFVPPGTLQATLDTMVGTGGRDWYRVNRRGSSVSFQNLGAYERTCSSCSTACGDAFSVQGVGTFASVYDRGDTAYSTIVRVDPLTGNIQDRIVRLDQGRGHSRVYGLAGWTDGFVYAFDESGDVLKVDVTARTYTTLTSSSRAWWGAAVRTVLPPTPKP
jgi:hypothetical protein